MLVEWFYVIVGLNATNWRIYIFIFLVVKCLNIADEDVWHGRGRGVGVFNGTISQLSSGTELLILQQRFRYVGLRYTFSNLNVEN